MRSKTLLAVLVVFVAAPSALWAVPKPGDIPPLLKKLKSSSPGERAAAMKELGDIGRVKASYVRAAVPAILAAAKDEKDASVRRAALAALGQVDPDPEKAVPVFIDALKTDNEPLQLAALQGLTYLGPKARAALPEIRRIQGEIRKLGKQAGKKKRRLGKAAGAALKAIGGKKKKG